MQSPSWEANWLQLVKKFPAFYGTRRFITALTSVRHLSLSWGSSVQSIPLHYTSWSSILMLSSHLCLGLPSGLFPSGFPTKNLYTPLSSPIRATWPAHLILLDFFHPHNIGWAVQIIKLLIMQFSPLPLQELTVYQFGVNTEHGDCAVGCYHQLQLFLQPISALPPAYSLRHSVMFTAGCC